MSKENITIVGLGWGSLGFIQTIDTSKYNVLLISNNGAFLYTPLLAQNVKHKRNLKITAKEIQKKFDYVEGLVNDVDLTAKTISYNKVNKKYDHLILSHGAETNTFNIPGVKENTYFLKTQEDVDKIIEKLETLPKNANISVIGCGLTGSELIGTLSTMNKFNITAIDALPRPLVTFNEKLSNYTINHWKNQDIKMHFNSMVTKVDESQINLKDKSNIKYDMAFWCGGIKPNSLTNLICKKYQLNGRRGIPVNEQLQIEKYDAFAIGDCAFSKNPPTAQVAYQQGIYLANRFNNKTNDPFVFNNKGQIGYIGHNESVYQNSYFSGGGKIIYILNNMIHMVNFGKMYIFSKW